MKVKTLLVLIVKGQNFKTPVTVAEHEIPILRYMHGGDNDIDQETAVEITDIAPAIPFLEIHSVDDEYARLKNFYMAGADKPNPARVIYPTLKTLEEALVEHVDEADGADLYLLLEQAKELGIKVDKRWIPARLQAEIDKKLAEWALYTKL